jgi:plasmid stability protein
MTAILIRDLEPHFIETLKADAAALQLSLNRYVKQLLTQTLAQRTKQPASNSVRNDLAQFAGGWTKRDAKEFDDATAMFNTIDPEVWAQSRKP